MNKLISRIDIAKWTQISETIYEDVSNALILETQVQDLMPLLGERLFNNLITTPTPYADLLNGSTYLYDGVSYVHYGLKAVLSHYFKARYIMHGNIIDTPFSTIEKLEGNESRPISYAQKKDRNIIERDTAFTYWKSVENFLIRTKDPLFSLNHCQTSSNSTFRIRKIV